MQRDDVFMSNSFFNLNERNENDKYKYIFICFVIASIFCSHLISNLSISPDDEFAAFRVDASAWIKEGRWAAYLIENFLLPNPSLMFWPYIFYAFMMSISYYFIIKQFTGINNSVLFLLFPILCVFASIWVLLEFSSNTPALAIGFFCTSLASAQFNKLNNFELKSVLTIISLCVFSAATYQVIVFCFYLISIAVVYNNRYNLTKKEIVSRVIMIILFTFLSIIIYFVITKIIQTFFVPSRGYVEKFIDISRLFHDPVGQLKIMFKAIYKVYFLHQKTFGYKFPMLIVVFIAFTFSCLAKRTHFLFSIFFITNLLLIPFVINLFADTSNFPLRLYLTLGLTFWLMLVTMIKNTGGVKIYFYFSMTITSLFIMNNMWIISNYQALSVVSQQRESLLAERIFNRIEILSDNNIQESYVIDIRGGNRGTFIFNQGIKSFTQSDFFGHNKDPINRVTRYMTLLGYPVTAAKKSVRKSNDDFFKEMKPWPHPDSIRKVGDVYLIKLSD